MPRVYGTITRGTTNTNRLRRIDRWIANSAINQKPPLVVDLGFGASGVTTFELASRLRRKWPGSEVLGIEIDPARVAKALTQLAEIRNGNTAFAPDLAVKFVLGGFEIPSPQRPNIIRACNVLRQYAEDEVANAWRVMCARLAPGGILIDGTCDELGRVCSWISLAESGPQSLTISLRLAKLDLPSIVAERLPKALIHHNVPGEPINDLLRDLDHAWQVAAPLSVYSPAQRFMAAVGSLKHQGWHVVDGPRRWRLGELTVAWKDVAPIMGS